MVRLAVLSAVVVSLLGAGLALHADERPQALTDQDFAKKAMEGNMAEVKLGELAEKQAANEKVKEFARRMVKDHSEANKKLSEISKAINVAAVTELPKEKQEAYAKLSQLKGEEFDRAYLQMMVQSHQKGVQMYEAQASKGTNNELKSFAQQTLPTVREHLKMAQSLAGGAGGSGGEKNK